MATANSKNFTLQIDGFLRKVDANVDAIIRKVIIDVAKRIIYRSPVGQRELWAINVERKKKGLPGLLPKGYVGGRFRANWQYGNDTIGIPVQPIDAVDPSGGQTMAGIVSSVPVSKLAGMRHLITNNLPYAQRLEDGWSKQAPVGMVGVTVREFSGMVENAAKEVNK